MRRKSVLAAEGLFLFFSLFALAQQPFQLPAPKLPANVIGPQLIAWSDLQKPQPTPQPLPPPERADQSQPANQSQEDRSQAQPQTEQPSAQAFTGTIVKDRGKYSLKVSDAVAYQIDDQEKAKTYEGKQVKVSGILDAKTNLLHVNSIELIS
jgi:hypothetical protein